MIKTLDGEVRKYPEFTVIGQLLHKSPRELARIWVDFNVWEWPRDLLDSCKPYWWDGKDDEWWNNSKVIIDRQYGYSDSIMRYIESLVSQELIDEEWKKRQNQEDF